MSQSFLQEMGGAKAGTKSIYNGKIEKLKKIWRRGSIYTALRVSFINMQLMSFTCSFSISMIQFFQTLSPRK